MVEVFICIGIVICLIWLIWGLHANKVTYEQRIAILNSIENDKFWEKCAALKRVTYDQHYNAVMLFKDPYALYDPILFEKVQDENQ